MASNPSAFKACDKCPVENVSWDDAQQFLQRLNKRKDGYQYRLPSEAEWEYACRAGTTTEFYFGDDPDSGEGSYAKRTARTTPVGTYKPNAFGLYDMHGNVNEWCQDIWHQNYDGAPVDGSAWMDVPRDFLSYYGTIYVMRGGSWSGDSFLASSASRGRNNGDARWNGLGFRILTTARK